MKKIVLFFLLICGLVQAQDVVIPDANFLTKLLEANSSNQIAYGGGSYIKIDSNDDGLIQISEAIVVDSLNVNNAVISDLTGILEFNNLKKLDCSNNNLNFLFLPGMTSLKQLYCSQNVLNTLTLDGVVNLEDLICSNNNLLTLNLTDNVKLTRVFCARNNLTALDISTLPALTTLYCIENEIVTLDATNCVAMNYLTCSKNKITSLLVGGLSQLQTLSADNNELSVLNVSGLSNLISLGCSNNHITSLDLSGLTDLQVLYCSFNTMTSMNLTGDMALTSINCSNNLLDEVDLSSLINLQGADFSHNELTQITFPIGLNAFTNTDVSYNHLTALDFSGTPLLAYLNCDHNDLATLDLSSNPLVVTLNCNDNDLESITVKNGVNQDFNENFTSQWSNNPNLRYVCADEEEIADVLEIVVSSALANVNVNSYCTFAPGGDYNTITGNILFDGNNNGCGSGDNPYPYIKVKINDGTTEGSTFNTATGDYAFHTQAGSFTVTPNIENEAFFTFSPANAVINFADNNNNIATQNFCITANGIHPDLEIVVIPITVATPGFLAGYKIVYKNKGNQLMSQQYGINFFFNHNLMNLVTASQPTSSQNLGALSWDYANLMPFESRSITILMHVNSPTDANPVNINDVLQLTASILPVANDETTADNISQLNQIVVGSYDPNDKQCVEGSVVSPTKIGEYLHYVINFENTGTAPAQTIVVKDVIDTAKFDIETLQILDSSHSVRANVSGGKAEFLFQNINLGSGGHGNILLKIKTKAGLSEGDQVTNKADIFFDYNYPIETNVARTTFELLLGLNENNMDDSISIYPNPTSDVINIKSISTIKSMELYDVQGRLLMVRMSDQLNEVIDLTSKSDGIYFVKITTDKGVKVEKLVKK